MKVMTSREFNQDVSRAKRAARLEPVFITDRGRPTHVLVSVEAWRRATGGAETIVDLLAEPGAGEVDPQALSAGGLWDGREEA